MMGAAGNQLFLNRAAPMKDGLLEKQSRINSSVCAAAPGTDRRSARKRRDICWTSVAFLAALFLFGRAAPAEEPVLKFRFAFDETVGATAASDTSNGGIRLILHTLDRAGAPADRQAAPGSGPAHCGGALHFSRDARQERRGPVVATATNASLGFGEVRAFTATLWFKLDRLSGKSRLFLLRAAGETPAPGTTNGLEIGLWTPRELQFKVNGISAGTILPFSLPTNQWLFAAMVYDGTNLRGYVGAEVLRATLVTTTAASGQAVGLGTNGALFLGNGPLRIFSFPGWLADARFYAGAGNSRFIEHIRQAAAGGEALAGDFHPPGLGLPESTDTLASTQGVWLVAAAPAFRAPLAPLIEHRRAQGFKVLVVETTNVLSPEEIWLSQGAPLAACIRRSLEPGKGPNYVLLGGAAGTPDPAAAQQTVVPALPGRNGAMKHWPSDYAYGLPRRDQDGECAAAVGRFPARTVEEMQGMVEKTLSMEQYCRRPGAWRNRLALIEGNPGAGALGEMFAEQLMTQRLGRLHPAWGLRAVSHIPSSAYYCPSTLLHSAALDCLQAGALFSVYMGHSSGEGLGSLGSTFLSRADWAGLKPGPGQGVFFSCGCFGCELGGGDGYCLAAMRNPAGPAAVIGASAESYAAAGLLAADGLLRCLARTPFPSRLADYWLAVQAGLARGPIDDLTFRLLDHSDGTGGKVPLAMQRLEDLEMWMLLGDPALRLPVVPVDITFEMTGPVRSGQGLTVKGTVPAQLAGVALRVTLERPLLSRPLNLEPLPPDSPDNRAARDRIAADNCGRANQSVLASATAVANEQRFQCVLAAPKLPWPEVVVRAFAEEGDECAQGVAVLRVGGD
jgi:hypothetical protein